MKIKKNTRLLLLLLSLVLALPAGCAAPLGAPPTATATQTAVPTATATQTLTPTATATLTPTPTLTATATPVPEITLEELIGTLEEMGYLKYDLDNAEIVNSCFYFHREAACYSIYGQEGRDFSPVLQRFLDDHPRILVQIPIDVTTNEQLSEFLAYVFQYPGNIIIEMPYEYVKIDGRDIPRYKFLAKDFTMDLLQNYVPDGYGMFVTHARGDFINDDMEDIYGLGMMNNFSPEALKALNYLINLQRQRDDPKHFDKPYSQSFAKKPFMSVSQIDNVILNPKYVDEAGITYVNIFKEQEVIDIYEYILEENLTLDQAYWLSGILYPDFMAGTRNTHVLVNGLKSVSDNEEKVQAFIESLNANQPYYNDFQPTPTP